MSVDEELHDSLFDTIDDGKGKLRAYLVTLNNPTDEELQLIQTIMANQEKNLKYAVIGHEIAPTTGTPHIHVYFHFVNQHSFSSIKKKFPRARIDTCRGSPQQVSQYCKKENNYKEIGEVPAQGKRSDIDHIKDVLEYAPRMREVTKVAKSVQAIKFAEYYLKYHEPKRDWKPYVKWYWGGTGTGKSRAAFDELGVQESFPCSDSAKWWDGYDAHEGVIIDEMREDFCSLKYFLRLTDRYPFTVQVKGTTRQFLARTIIITSPYPPEKLYRTNEDTNQLLRRLDEIKHFGPPLGEEQEEESDEETDEPKKTTISSEMKSYFEQK